jgi:hypothetical protein
MLNLGFSEHKTNAIDGDNTCGGATSKYNRMVAISISCVDTYMRNGQPNYKHMSYVQGQRLNANGAGAFLRRLLVCTGYYGRIEIMQCMTLQSRATTE